MTECNICFEDFKRYDKILECKICDYKYHKKCYIRWNNIKKDNKCIFCMSKNCIINVKSKKKIKNNQNIGESMNSNKILYPFYCCNIL